MNSWFYGLVIAGLMLIGAEVFVPGGVLGTLGAMALVAAIIMAFSIFSTETAVLVAFLLVVMSGGMIVLWIRIFPRTGLGRQMTVLRDLKDAKGGDCDRASLIGKTGVTCSALRPAGYVEIDHQRMDVVSNGDMIEVGTPVRVVALESNHLVVEAIDTSLASASPPSGTAE